MSKPVKMVRLFSDFYDSIQQRRLSDLAGDPHYFSRNYRARLRFDWLVHKTVVVTDAQYFDGAFFSPQTQSLLDDILPTHPDGQPSLELRARSLNLEDTILGFVRDKFGKPGGFVFSLIPDSQCRSNVQEAIARWSGNVPRSLGDLVAFLRGAGVPDDDVERIHDGWNYGIEAFLTLSKKGLLKVCGWEHQYDLDGAFKYEPDWHAKSYLRTQEGRELLDEVSGKRHDRGNVFRIFEDYRRRYLAAPTCAECQDACAVESWFHRGYNRALSIQHSCLFDTMDAAELAVGEPRELFDRICKGARVPEDPAVELPLQFMEQLQAMPRSLFEIIAFENRRHLNDWWDNGNVFALETVIGALARKMDLASTPSRALEYARVPLKVCAGLSPGAKVVLGALRLVIGELVGDLGHYIPRIGAASRTLAHPVPILSENIYDYSSPKMRIARRVVEFVESRGE